MTGRGTLPADAPELRDASKVKKGTELQLLATFGGEVSSKLGWGALVHIKGEKKPVILVFKDLIEKAAKGKKAAAPKKKKKAAAPKKKAAAPKKKKAATTKKAKKAPAKKKATKKTTKK